MGGTWDDGTTGEKTVMLTGHDGDVLRLSDSQIPKAGARPNYGHKAGSWDTTPSTEAAIDGDTVYTYTYEAFTYSCTDGDGSSWAKESTDELPLTFTRSDEDQTNRAFDHFGSVTVDGNAIEDGDYTVSQGDGAAVTLMPSFLSTLGNGEHTLRATFDDGAAEGKFNVRPATRTVSFDANGGTGEMQRVTAAEGSKVKLPKSVFERDGYAFAGWNTKADGTGTAYADQAEVEVAGDMVLYAQWKKNTTTQSTTTKPTTSKTTTPQTTTRNSTTTTPQTTARNDTTTTKTLPKAGESDFGSAAALLGIVASAMLLAARAVRE